MMLVPQTRNLRVDAAAQQTLDDLISDLRAARVASGRTQESVAAGLPFRGRAISEWETRAVTPKCAFLILWSDALQCRLAIVGPDGQERKGLARQRPGEAWETFERRRLGSPMRERRRNAGMSQDKAGDLVGVSGNTIDRWELAAKPPRPIALIVWARTFGYDLALRTRPTRSPRDPGKHAEAAPKTDHYQGEQ